MKRLRGRRAGADLTGQCRQAQIDALPDIALALPVQGLMLAELLEQGHGQQVGPGEAARRHVERRRRLGDRLAAPARELLAHRLNYLPLAGELSLLRVIEALEAGRGRYRDAGGHSPAQASGSPQAAPTPLILVS